MLHLLFNWEYPHWMMIAGAVLVVLGFIGFAFHRNRNGPVDEPSRAAAKGQRAMRVQRLQVERFRSEVVSLQNSDLSRARREPKAKGK